MSRSSRAVALRSARSSRSRCLLRLLCMEGRLDRGEHCTVLRAIGCGLALQDVLERHDLQGVPAELHRRGTPSRALEGARGPARRGLVAWIEDNATLRFRALERDGMK
jgi:hypothetical protein